MLDTAKQRCLTYTRDTFLVTLGRSVDKVLLDELLLLGLFLHIHTHTHRERQTGTDASQNTVNDH
jgi:hypothetical protein